MRVFLRKMVAAVEQTLSQRMGSVFTTIRQERLTVVDQGTLEELTELAPRQHCLATRRIIPWALPTTFLLFWPIRSISIAEGTAVGSRNLTVSDSGSEGAKGVHLPSPGMSPLGLCLESQGHGQTGLIGCSSGHCFSQRSRAVTQHNGGTLVLLWFCPRFA
jgi:hypothetical protein